MMKLSLASLGGAWVAARYEAHPTGRNRFRMANGARPDDCVELGGRAGAGGSGIGGGRHSKASNSQHK